MRPAVEHAIRTGYLKHCLKTPFSLFLENIWDDLKHVVLTVSSVYGGREGDLVVRLWDIGNVNKNDNLPPRKESFIHAHEMFSSEHTIIDDYRTLEYYHEDYEYRVEPEGTDTAMWIEEEQEEYRSIMERYFFSFEHHMQRENILWYNFINGYLTESSCYIRSVPMDGQQCLIRESSPQLWGKWALWRKHLLDFSSKIAPELVFYQSYERKVKENHQYQETIIREALAEKEVNEWSVSLSNYEDVPVGETFVACAIPPEAPAGTNTQFVV